MNESQQTLSAEPYGDEIDLLELIRVVWAGKWLISGITLAGIAVAVIIALMLPNIYRAEALLAPNNQESSGGLSALAAQYGGLASLAGINLDSGSADKTALGLEILKSRKFIAEFVERHDILAPLMAANGWVAQTKELEFDSGDYDVASGEWVREVSPPRKTIPSLQEAHEEFLKILSVTQDKTSGLVTIAVEHYSPIIAKQWVEWLVEDLNSTVMLQDVTKAEQSIEYLHQQISSTSLADLQSVFFALIEEQTKTVMLARVSPEYMLRTIDPAVAPERKVKPRRLMICFLGMIIGGLFGIVLVLIRNASTTAKD